MGPLGGHPGRRPRQRTWPRPVGDMPTDAQPFTLTARARPAACRGGRRRRADRSLGGGRPRPGTGGQPDAGRPGPDPLRGPRVERHPGSWWPCPRPGGRPTPPSTRHCWPALAGQPQRPTGHPGHFFAHGRRPAATAGRPPASWRPAGPARCCRPGLAHEHGRRRLRLTAFDGTVSGADPLLGQLDDDLLSSESSGPRTPDRPPGGRLRAVPGRPALAGPAGHRTHHHPHRAHGDHPRHHLVLRPVHGAADPDPRRATSSSSPRGPVGAAWSSITRPTPCGSRWRPAPRGTCRCT